MNAEESDGTTQRHTGTVPGRKTENEGRDVTTAVNATHDTALEYALKDLRVFPLHSIDEAGACTCGKADCGSPGKHPRTKNGVKDATTDVEQIAAWWAKWPDANVGIATGNGLLVLDVDTKHDGIKTIEQMEEAEGPMPETAMVLTGGGGRHYYFYLPPDKREGVKNAVGIGRGLDLRFDGGYVVAPPSRHVSGRTYEWEASSELSTGYTLPPVWLLRAIHNGSSGSKPTKTTTNPSDSLRDPDAILAGVDEGSRDVALFRYACLLRRDKITRAQADALILKAAASCDPPFPEKDALRKVEQAWEYPSEKAKLLAGETIALPAVEAQGTNAQIKWGAIGIEAHVRGLKEHTDGRINGFLSIISTLSGQAKKLHSATFNFTSTRTRSEWKKVLEGRAPITDWFEVLEQLCDAVTKVAQQGEPVQVITTSDEVTPPSYVLRPILLYKQPVILFGDRGSTKSYTAQTFAYLLALGQMGRLLDFQPERVATKPLYLDWEDTPSTLRWRFKCLSKGTGLPSAQIAYRRCSRTLASDTEQIRTVILAGGYDYLIVDSLGPACGGDLNSPQPALEFFESLRSLNVSSLVIAHTAKGNAGRSRRSVFGSVFFENAARSIWEINADSEEGSAKVVLTHTKMNGGPPEAPIAMQYVFEHGSTAIVEAKAEEVAAAAGAMTIRQKILQLLGDLPSADTKRIAEDLGESPATIRVTLSRMRTAGLIDKLESGAWVKIADVADIAPF